MITRKFCALLPLKTGLRIWLNPVVDIEFDDFSSSTHLDKVIPVVDQILSLRIPTVLTPWVASMETYAHAIADSFTVARSITELKFDGFRILNAAVTRIRPADFPSLPRISNRTSDEPPDPATKDLIDRANRVLKLDEVMARYEAEHPEVFQGDDPIGSRIKAMFEKERSQILLKKGDK